MSGTKPHRCLPVKQAVVDELTYSGSAANYVFAGKLAEFLVPILQRLDKLEKWKDLHEKAIQDLEVKDERRERSGF